MVKAPYKALYMGLVWNPDMDPKEQDPSKQGLIKSLVCSISRVFWTIAQ